MGHPDVPTQSARDDREPDPSKQIKVKLPVELIMRLQEIRILEGRSVADVVKAALEEYFQRLHEPKTK